MGRAEFSPLDGVEAEALDGELAFEVDGGAALDAFVHGGEVLGAGEVGGLALDPADDVDEVAGVWKPGEQRRSISSMSPSAPTMGVG